MKPLDDPQLRAKLIKASGDMPHVDVWARIQAEAVDISQTAQARTTRTRFSIFSGLQLLAPAFVVLLVFGVTLLSLTDMPSGETQRATSALSAHNVTASWPSPAFEVPAYHASNQAYDRLMARYADRLEGMPPEGHSPASDSLAVTYEPGLQAATAAQVETRDDMRMEWQEYAEQKQARSRSDALHLIRPFLSPLTPQ